MRGMTHISGFWRGFGVFGPSGVRDPRRGGCFTSTPPPGAGEPERGSGDLSGIAEGSGRPGPGGVRDGTSDPGGNPYQAPRRGPRAPGTGPLDPEPPGTSGPGARPRPLRRGGFYINPSRRGPAPRLAGEPVPGIWDPSGVLDRTLPTRRGNPPFPAPRDFRGQGFPVPSRDGGGARRASGALPASFPGVSSEVLADARDVWVKLSSNTTRGPRKNHNEN